MFCCKRPFDFRKARRLFFYIFLQDLLLIQQKVLQGIEFLARLGKTSEELPRVKILARKNLVKIEQPQSSCSVRQRGKVGLRLIYTQAHPLHTTHKENTHTGTTHTHEHTNTAHPNTKHPHTPPHHTTHPSYTSHNQRTYRHPPTYCTQAHTHTQTPHILKGQTSTHTPRHHTYILKEHSSTHPDTYPHTNLIHHTHLDNTHKHTPYTPHAIG